MELPVGVSECGVTVLCNAMGWYLILGYFLLWTHRLQTPYDPELDGWMELN